MHSSLVRAQNVFGFFTTVAFVVGVLVSISVVLFPADPRAAVAVRNVRVVKARQQQQYSYSKQQEFAVVNFDLDADLETLFNWNTKQVFVYLTATYPGAKGSKYSENEAVIWDAILPSRSASKLHLANERAKYSINDISGKFLERNGTLRFYWNVQPHVGALTWGSVDLGARGTEEGVDVEKGEAEGWRFAFPALKAGKNGGAKGS